MRYTITAVALFLASSIASVGWTQDANVVAVAVVPLWPEGAPEANGLEGDDKPGNWGCISNISTATLTVHLPDEKKATGKAVVITPGGGYGVVCAESEGKAIADLLVPQGTAAIVLRYRLPNQHHRVPSSDARRAIRTVRHNAKAWKIDPDKIGIWGFSAGGHLASTVSTAFDTGVPDAADPIERWSSRPDFSILFYPVVSMEDGVTHAGSRRNLLGEKPSNELLKKYSNHEQITKNTPPTFILHAADDRVVPLKNSMDYYSQLISQGVAARLLVYETGGHGPTAFQENPTWKSVFDDWMSKR